MKRIRNNDGQAISELTDITPVAFVDGTATIDLAGRYNKAVAIESEDADPKSIAIISPPSAAGKRIQVNVRFIATTACAITHPTGATFANGTPSFTTGQEYELLYTSIDGGTTYEAYSMRAV